MAHNHEHPASTAQCHTRPRSNAMPTSQFQRVTINPESYGTHAQVNHTPPPLATIEDATHLQRVQAHPAPLQPTQTNSRPALQQIHAELYALRVQNQALETRLTSISFELALRARDIRALQAGVQELGQVPTPYLVSWKVFVQEMQKHARRILGEQYAMPQATAGAGDGEADVLRCLVQDWRCWRCGGNGAETDCDDGF